MATATVTTKARALAQSLNDAAAEAPPRTVAAAARLLGAAAERNELDHFFAHALNALVLIANASDTRSLLDVDSDYGALLRALDQPELLAALEPRDPLAPARLRGLRLQQELLTAEGGTSSAQAVADALGITRQAIDKRRKRGALIGLSLGRRGYAYPVWQIGLDGLEAVLAELRDLDPWTQTAFMLAPNRWLAGETPLEVLRRGNRDAVLQAARLYGEQIAA
jgi:hypothetical protein